MDGLVPITAFHCFCVISYLPIQNDGTVTGWDGLARESSFDPITNEPPGTLTISSVVPLPKSTVKYFACLACLEISLPLRSSLIVSKVNESDRRGVGAGVGVGVGFSRRTGTGVGVG